MRITAVTTLVPTAESVTDYAIRLLSNTLFIQNNVCTGSITGNVFKKVGSQEQQLVCGTECRVQFKWNNSSSWLEADYMSGVFLDTAFLSGSYNGGKTVQIRATNRAGDTILQQEVIFPNFAGNNGSAGPLPYLAGEWNVATSYTRTETKCPIVVYSNQYYFLRKIGTVTGGNNPAYEAALPNGKWIHADNFQMVITECLMAAFGKIASAVFSGDYMISQYGISNGDENANNYSDFNAAHPDSEEYFAPNVYIDFLHGKLRANTIFQGLQELVFTSQGDTNIYNINEGVNDFSCKSYTPTILKAKSWGASFPVRNSKVRVGHKIILPYAGSCEGKVFEIFTPSDLTIGQTNNTKPIYLTAYKSNGTSILDGTVYEEDGGFVPPGYGAKIVKGVLLNSYADRVVDLYHNCYVKVVSFNKGWHIINMNNAELVFDFGTSYIEG